MVFIVGFLFFFFVFVFFVQANLIYQGVNVMSLC